MRAALSALFLPLADLDRSPSPPRGPRGAPGPSLLAERSAGAATSGCRLCAEGMSLVCREPHPAANVSFCSQDLRVFCGKSTERFSGNSGRMRQRQRGTAALSAHRRATPEEGLGPTLVYSKRKKKIN